MSTLLWLTPIGWPFLAAVLVLRRGRGRAALVASGPLPALALAALGPPGTPPELSWILLDLRLGLDPITRVLLLTTALVWLGAGIAARELLRRRGGAAMLWLVTLGGNVGLVLADDVVSLYALYGVMTFAAYGLVVLDRSNQARRAGRLYVVLAVLGEALLLAGLVLGAGAAGSTGNAAVAAALATAPDRDLVIALLATGFAVKAGIVPLHVWLPLAHPAAPVPASAALSGAMIKAGLVGWLTLLPLGAMSAPGWSATFVAVGLVTALWGAAVGVLQDRPKVVLAYSSISQMGLIAMLVGLAFASPSAAPVGITAAVVSALHHGVAKGALFLGVGVRSSWTGPRGRRLVLAGTAIAGLSLAGVPLSSGWVAKSLTKSALASADLGSARTLTWLLSLAAVGTTLLITRLLVLLARPVAADRPRSAGPAAADVGGRIRTDRGLVAGWALLLVATLVATWTVPGAWLSGVSAPKLSAMSLWDATWPILAGLLVTAAALLLARRRGSVARSAPRIPPGDLLVVAEVAVPVLDRATGRVVAGTVRVRDRLAGVVTSIEARVRPGEGFATLDVRLRRWQMAGALFLLVGASLIVTLAR